MVFNFFMPVAQYQYSSGHHIMANSLVLDGSNQVMEPTTVATKPRTTPCYKVYLVSLIHTIKGSCQVVCLSAQHQYAVLVNP
jgi:hypothetical protein